MSELKVEVVTIENYTDHPNADRLGIAKVQGYDVVVGKGQYKVGDAAVYFPVDSVIPPDLEAVIFANSKMQLSKGRVRAARIRGAMSFGLLVDMPKIRGYLEAHGMREGIAYLAKINLTARLGVKKFEPPAKGSPQANCNPAAKRYVHPLFSKYTDVQHGKKYTLAWEDYKDSVVLTEKIHGTNFRCGWLPYIPRTKLQKVRTFLSKWVPFVTTPKFEFVYGSHNVQLQDGNPKPGAPAHDNVYKRAVNMFGLRDKIKPGELWYFEIYGPGIQAGYEYGLKPGEIGLAVIDIRQSDRGRYHSWLRMAKLCKARGLKHAPVLHYSSCISGCDIDTVINKQDGTAARSVIDFKTPIEGGVLRPYAEDKFTFAGRFLFKFISDEYLLNKNNTDNH